MLAQQNAFNKIINYNESIVYKAPNFLPFDYVYLIFREFFYVTCNLVQCGKTWKIEKSVEMWEIKYIPRYIKIVQKTLPSCHRILKGITYIKLNSLLPFSSFCWFSLQLIIKHYYYYTGFDSQCFKKNAWSEIRPNIFQTIKSFISASQDALYKALNEPLYILNSVQFNIQLERPLVWHFNFQSTAMKCHQI